MAADREMQEAWQRFSTLWAQQAAALLQAVTFDPPGRAGPAPPARSATADAASVAAAGTAGIDPRDAVIAALVERVAALERRDG